MQTESATFEQHVYYTPTKERTEMQGLWKKLRTDAGPDSPRKIQGHVATDAVAENVYGIQSRPTGPKHHEEGPADMTKWDFEETVVGEEVMEGVNVTK